LTLADLLDWATDKTRFASLSDYTDFARAYGDWVVEGRQAIILCQNERNYRLFQYGDDGFRNISRPINSDIWLDRERLDRGLDLFSDALAALADTTKPSAEARQAIVPAVYTIQQSIGAALDGLAPGKSNQARKLNGQLFERLVEQLVRTVGVPCTSSSIRVPVLDEDGIKLFDMPYQRDLVVTDNDRVVLIGSVKTSSKDRIDKVFLDKFLFSKLSETDVPHVAIYLNDVQRVGSASRGQAKIGSTFLTNRFKGYSLKLCALDGVYYCDLRPNMKTDPVLAKAIGSFDQFLCEDVFTLIAASRGVAADLTEDTDEEPNE